MVQFRCMRVAVGAHLVFVTSLLALSATGATAQRADSLAAPRPGARLSGLVYDSLGHRPLPLALVQLVDAAGALPARSANADSSGRFVLDDVAAGKYQLGFFHPFLDSLGLEAPVREVSIAGRRAVRMDLAIPSSTRLRSAICNSDEGGLILGVAREAGSREPLAGASITGDWLEIQLQKGNMSSHRPRMTVTTADNGWYALCNVPRGGTMFLGALHGERDTDYLEVQVPQEGFLRRDLFLAPARGGIDRHGELARLDSVGVSSIRMRRGDGRISGQVMNREIRQPLEGAIVRVAEGPMTRTNERGEWTLTGIPAGSRVLEVRAIGFYPEQRSVDVLDGAPALSVGLAKFKSVLDTVRVLAAGSSVDRLGGFEQRRRSGIGRYLGLQDIERRGALEIGDVFRSIGGVRSVRDSSGTNLLFIRDSFGGWCQPPMYIDGMLFFTISIDELNTFVKTRDVLAMEVYDDATVPPQYRRPALMTQSLDNPVPLTVDGTIPGANPGATTPASVGCGAVLIWTKAPQARNR